MARDTIEVLYPSIENTLFVSSVAITKNTVTATNGIEIKSVFANKNNSLIIIIENTAASDCTITFKAGDTYPNRILGDLTIPIKQTSLLSIQIQDLARFENQDKSIYIDFDSNFTGFIYAIAKSTDLTPAF